MFIRIHLNERHILDNVTISKEENIRAIYSTCINE